AAGGGTVGGGAVVVVVVVRRPLGGGGVGGVVGGGVSVVGAVLATPMISMASGLRTIISVRLPNRRTVPVARTRLPSARRCGWGGRGVVNGNSRETRQAFGASG